MAFATTILDKQAAKSWGIIFDLYNPLTFDTVTVSCSPSRAFQPTFQPNVLETSQPSFELRFGKPMSKLSDFTWAIANGPLQAGANISHVRASDLFANGYMAIGQSVKLWMLVLNGMTIEHDQRWKGIITDCRWDPERIEFTAKHVVLKALEAITPATKILLANYPEAPSESIGAPLPIALGDWSIDPTDAGNSDAWNKSAELMQLTPIERVLPTICVDTNMAYPVSGPKFVLAGHACKSCPPATSNAVFYYNSELEQYTVVLSTDLTITNSASETSALLGPKIRVSAAITPNGADGSSTALNPTYAYDGNLATAATMSATYAALHLLLPDIPDIGIIESLTVYVHTVSGTLSGSEALEFGLNDSAFTAWWPAVGSHTSIATITADAIESYAITGAMYRTGDLPADLGIAINIINGAGGVVYIGEVRLAIKYARQGNAGRYPARSKGKIWYPPTRGIWSESERFPDLREAGTTIYMAATGVADSGGMYTGAGTDLIERPCDIIMYLAATQALLSPLTTGHGDFTVARADIDTIGLTGRVFIDKQQVVGDLMSRLAEESLCGLMLNATSLGLVFWGSVWSDNYYGAIDGADLMGTPEIGMTSLDEVRNAIYLQCGYHATLKKCKHMAYCDKDGSDNGAGTADYSAPNRALLAASETTYGRKELHLNCEHLRVAEISHIRDYYAAMLREPRVTVKFTVPWKYYALEVGHVIDMDDASWHAVGLNYPGSSGGKVGYWSYGAETHRFWVERITYQEHGTMEIEASEGVW